MKPPRTLPVMLLGLGLGLAGAACTSPTPSPPTTRAVPAPTTPSPPGTPATAAVPTGFRPGSVTFVSSTTGFVIGVDPSCPAGTCVALARTTDRGSSWEALPAPTAGYAARGTAASASAAALVSEVRFADEMDGWIYGPSLFATHDGGASWKEIDLGGPVVALETSGGYVDAVVSPCSGAGECTGPMAIYQAPSSGGAFTKVLSGPTVSSGAGDEPDLSLHAPVGFANLASAGQGSLYATSGLSSGAGGWKPFPDPCASTTNAHFGPVGFVATNTTDLWTLCGGSAGAGSEAKTVMKTTNGVSVVAGSPPAGGDAEGLAATASGTLVVAAASGASELYLSTDGGALWTTAETYDDGGVGFNDLGFTTATQGVVIHGLPGPPGNFSSQLLMTFDGGSSWNVVPIS